MKSPLYFIKNLNLISFTETYNYNNLGTWHANFERPYSHQFHHRFKCTQPGLYADENDCQTYYECAKTENEHRLEFRQTVHKCNSNKVFSYAYGGTCIQPHESERVKCSGYSRFKREAEEQHNTGIKFINYLVYT